MRVKVSVTVDLPKHLLQEYVQHIRDFDTKHDVGKKSDVQFVILMSGDITPSEGEHVIRSIKPPFDFVIKNDEKKEIKFHDSSLNEPV